MSKKIEKYHISPEHQYNALMQEGITRLNIKYQILFWSITIAWVFMAIAIENKNPFIAFITPLLLWLIWLIDGINNEYWDRLIDRVNSDFEELESNYEFKKMKKFWWLKSISMVLSVISIIIWIYYLYV